MENLPSISHTFVFGFQDTHFVERCSYTAIHFSSFFHVTDSLGLILYLDTLPWCITPAPCENAVCAMKLPCFVVTRQEVNRCLDLCTVTVPIFWPNYSNNNFTELVVIVLLYKLFKGPNTCTRRLVLVHVVFAVSDAESQLYNHLYYICLWLGFW